MKNIVRYIFLLLVVLLIPVASYSTNSNKKEKVKFIATFASSVEGEAPNPTGIYKSIILKFTDDGKVTNRLRYNDILATIKFYDMENEKYVFLSGPHGGFEKIFGVNKKDLSLNKYKNMLGARDVYDIDNDHIYSFSNKQTSFINKLDISLKKEKVLEINHSIEHIENKGNRIYALAVDSNNGFYYFYEIDKNTLTVKNKIKTEIGSDKRIDETYYIKNEIYIKFDDLYNNSSVIYRYKNNKFLKDSSLDYMKDFIKMKESKNHIYFLDSEKKGKKLVIFNKKNGTTKDYSISKKVSKDPFMENYEIYENHIYYVLNVEDSFEKIPKYRFIKYDFKKGKIKRKVDINIGAGKREYFYLQKLNLIK